MSSYHHCSTEEREAKLVKGLMLWNTEPEFQITHIAARLGIAPGLLRKRIREALADGRTKRELSNRRKSFYASTPAPKGVLPERMSGGHAPMFNGYRRNAK